MPAAGPHGLRPSTLTVPTPRRRAACHSCSPAAVAVRAADSDTASANTTVAVLTPRANIQGAEDDYENEDQSLYEDGFRHLTPRVRSVISGTLGGFRTLRNSLWRSRSSPRRN